ncbi:MAG TPA: DCC1-like thiol-disulfide oxidoreductase family protein [bacterium]|nr:DCC1-like thiol-disulfide oxidoreductase family protein [bacterium]
MGGRFCSWITKEHASIGAAIVRISLGTWAVFFYTLFWRDRQLLWGPNGIYPYERFLGESPVLNLFAVSSSPIYVDMLYLAGLIIAVLFTVGCLTRLMTVLHWLMIWSIQTRNDFLGDGGDNIMRIVLLFFVLVNAGAVWSLDASRRPWRGEAILRPILAVVHNFGILAIMLQLGFLYMSTGLYKVMGELWQNGTALYYILRVDEFSWPGVAEHLYRNPYLVVGATYGTVLFEVMFGPLLLNRWTRLFAVIPAGILFHLGIGTVMGLPTFAWSMLSLYPLLVTDGEYQAAGGWVRRRLGLTVYYDGWCPACTRSVRWLNRLDLLSLVHYGSFRGLSSVDKRRAERRILSVDERGRVREGMDVMVQIAARSPLLWLSVIPLLLIRLVAGQRAYDFVASRRLILVPGPCGDHCPVSEQP